MASYRGIKALGISEEVMRRYSVEALPSGKFEIKLSSTCSKILSADGSYSFRGEYTPELGLFGVDRIIGQEMVEIVPSELEVLKRASLGFTAICLLEPRQLDSISMGILEDSLKTKTSELIVVTKSSFNKRMEALEAFLIHIARGGSIKLRSVEYESSILDMQESETAPVRDWKPTGITGVEDILARDQYDKPVHSEPTGYKAIDKAIGGLRACEVSMFTAGTGVGKSTIVREIAYYLAIKSGKKVGMVFLEEPDETTLRCIEAIHHQVPVHQFETGEHGGVSVEARSQFRKNPAFRNNFSFFNYFGSLSADRLMSRIEYMIDFEGCGFICLDHISMAVSGMSSKEGERKDIDILMTRLVSLAVAKKVHILAITHLSSPDGTPHEEGGRVTLNQLRGSKAISQLSMNIFGVERNQQVDGNRALLRVLKCRKTGFTGPCAVLEYFPKTGRLLEVTDISPKDFEDLLQPKKRGGYGKNAGGSFGSLAGGY